MNVITIKKKIICKKYISVLVLKPAACVNGWVLTLISDLSGYIHA